MFNQVVDIQQLKYSDVFLSIFLYFLILYFLVGTLFLGFCKILAHFNLLHKITKLEPKRRQIQLEVLHSLKSIFIFSISALVLLWMAKNDWIEFSEPSFWNISFALLGLTLWNEVHFYSVHRLMHLPFFMKKVHYVHHRSKIPTLYAVFSFHWFEAFLLSTVPIFILPFIPLPLIAVILFPLVSILLNFAGHCNYRFGTGKGPVWTQFGTKHHQHHSIASKNYGFASSLLDKYLNKKINQPKS